MSKLVEWSDALSVGVDELDAQHKVLVGLINEMHAAIEERRGRDVVESILTRLAEYTRIHFAVEESLMQLLGFPDYDAHKQEHRELIVQVNALRRKVDNGETAIDFELMDFLKGWLTRHIMESDQEYARYFTESGSLPRLKKRSWTSRLWDHLHG
jgi:hemerythrin